GCPMARPPYRSLGCTSTRSAGAIGPACSTARTCRAGRGPTMSSTAASVRQGAACGGPRANRASPSARCNAKAHGNSSRARQQRPSYWVPWVTWRLRLWRKKDSALLTILNGSACSVAPSTTRERNSGTCVRGGRHYSLQVQGDCRSSAQERFRVLLVDFQARQVIDPLFVRKSPAKLHEVPPIVTPVGIIRRKGDVVR